jgi:predicted transcriptional regulator
MVFSLFGHKKRTERLKQDVQESFDHVRKDFNKIGNWIRHLDDKGSNHQEDLKELRKELLIVQEDLSKIKDFISFFGPQVSPQTNKQQQSPIPTQTVPSPVQTSVQTAVQTDFLSSLTVMERAIVWSLLNAEMNLSYEDIAALLGKKRSTIRGQINSIRQKVSGLIEEVREVTGKKRLYIPDQIKAEVLKTVKVRVKGKKR